MSKTIKKVLAGMLFACAMAVVLPVGHLVSMAASAKITFSDPSGEVGQEVTVNMKISTEDGSLGSADIILSYDASSLRFIEGNSVEGGAGTLRARGGPDPAELSNIVFSMRFQMIKEGTSQITISSQEIYDNNSQAVTISHQGNAAVSAVSTGAENAEGLLTSLAVAPGTLTPEFSPLIDSYSIHVGMDVERIEVQALAGEGSQVAVEGSEGLQMGENTVTIRVTAPDGVTVKNYSISVNKSEGGESTGSLEAQLAQGVSLQAAAKAITILAPEEEAQLPEVFSQISINIDGHEVPGWVWAGETDHQYCIFYAMDGAGKKSFYRYDLTEKTIQRYFLDPAAQSGYTKEETENIIQLYNSLLDDYKIRMYIIFALAAVAVVLLILVVVLLVTRSSSKDEGGKARPRERKADRVRSQQDYDQGDAQEDGTKARQDPGRLAVQSAQAVRKVQESVEEDEDFDIIDTPAEPEYAAAKAALPQEEAFDRSLAASGEKGEGVKESLEEDEDFEFLDVD